MTLPTLQWPLIHHIFALDCYEDVCNRHSDLCSQRLRTCQKCQDATHGPYCDFCDDGYYGNATRSKYGCKRCPCPLIRSNGSCTHDEMTNAFKCTRCNRGYRGDLCNDCTTGYYKDVKDNLCRPCFCSGHGNGSQEQQCDPVGGRCYTCMHMRAGKHCQDCLEGYYLNQVNGTEQCILCDCNGNEAQGLNPICDTRSGICFKCTQNTTGVNCEKCANGYKGDAIVAKNCTIIKRPMLGIFIISKFNIFGKRRLICDVNTRLISFIFYSYFSFF